MKYKTLFLTESNKTQSLYQLLDGMHDIMSSEFLFTHQLKQHSLKYRSWDWRIDIDSSKWRWIMWGVSNEFKIMLYLFSTHAWHNICTENIQYKCVYCTITPLIYIYIYIYHLCPFNVSHTHYTPLSCVSFVSRFEKLDITPKSAQKLKPVLERWLVEAELWNQKGQQNLMEFVGGEPSKKRKRRTSFTPQAIEVLNTYFEKNSLPTGQEITEISKELNYDREVVRVWFCNRRQTLKNTSKINMFQVQ